MLYPHDYLNNLSQSVIVEGNLPSTLPIVQGVAHGSMVGPITFSCIKYYPCANYHGNHVVNADLKRSWSYDKP